MATTRDPRKIEGESFLEGKLLIAMPGMSDPRFERGVIFMCAHSLDKGAMGLMVNKPIAGLGFRDLMEKLEIRVTANTPDFPILFGGPVDTGRGFVLHSGDYEGEQTTLPVSEDISLTASLDILRAMSKGEGPGKALFALGYAGWRPGQIEDEIRLNGWVHCDPDSEVLFDLDLESRWSFALKKMGIDVSALSAEAGRA